MATDLREALARALPGERVLTRPLDLALYATDASLYRIVPRAAVRPRDVEDVRALLALARRERVPLTFRASGTSLSGQAIGPGIVVDVSRDWGRLEIEDSGRRARVGPGVIAGQVNRRLAAFGAKLGPDPASIDACRIGGIVANNSSGMCCGVEHNAYRTLESLTLVLASGTLVDTAAPEASERLRAEEPAIWCGLAELRDRVRASAPLVERIRRKYRLKNTMGYSLNAFLDFDDPLEMLWHLVVGSEGTLAFVAEAVFRTVPDPPEKATGLLFFEDVPAACAAIAPLRATGPATLELMDRPALRSVEGRPGVPDLVGALPATAAALLVEHQADSGAALDRAVAGLAAAAASLPLLAATPATRDAAARAAMWAVRKGIIPSVGATRPPGTTLVTEDVVFPPEALAAGVLGLQALFRRHGYVESVVFGHAKDGNLHFLLSQGMNDPREVDRLAAFTADLTDLVVVRHDGALKAEHGTGRNMAPFVEAEWGPEAYAVMREVKRLLDPLGVLNPGVLLADDPRVHLANIKTIPAVSDEADRCIECGFCEPKCPSRDVTIGPRQRILVLREAARLRQAGRGADARAFEAAARYELLDTCATDGLCATACPVAIDTGRLVKQLRGRGHGALARGLAGRAAAHFGLVAGGARLGLGLARLLGRPGRARDLPPPAPRLPAMLAMPAAGADAIYFPSCVTRVLGPRPGEPDLAATVCRVASRAGLVLAIPPRIAGACCGLPFGSRGFPAAHARAASRTVERLWRASDGGRLPVVLDTSPCAFSLATCGDVLPAAEREHLRQMTIADSVAWAHERVLPRLHVRRRARAVALHPVCSLVKLSLVARLGELAAACADTVVTTGDAGCCGFAGDRGFVLPELTAAATRAAAAELAGRALDGCYASSRTCEIGLERATGRRWDSFWRLLDRAAAE